MNVAKIRIALGVKVDPQLEPFDLQILQIDVSSQVERVKIFDSHRRENAIDLAKFLASLCIVKFDAEQLDRLWRQRRVKVFDLSAYAVLCERVLDLAGDVAIDEAKPKREQ